VAPAASNNGLETRWSLLDLTAPVRSQIFFCMVGELLRYNGANEANETLDTFRGVCRELREQIDEECHTFNYDDMHCLSCKAGSDHDEIEVLNRCLARHRRIRYFECLLRSASRFRTMLDELQIPRATKCSFVCEFKMNCDDLHRLLSRFSVSRLSFIPEQPREDTSDLGANWTALPQTNVRTLCLRGCSDAMARSMLAASPRLQGLQIADSRLVNEFSVTSNLSSLSLMGLLSLQDEQFSRIIAGCQNLRSLYISKCHISHIVVSLPRLELLSVTHCRQLTDQCASELLQPSNNPAIRFVDFTEDRGLVSPTIAHPGLEIAWLLHCPQIIDSAVQHMFANCLSLTAASLVQSSIESALICSSTLRTIELTTSQKLRDGAVTQLLQHCPSLTFLDVGHCCQLLEPRLAHATLNTILLSLCVNLREVAIVNMFRDCPSLKYVELAVCMFDMTRFQRESRPDCQVVVNFDF